MRTEVDGADEPDRASDGPGYAGLLAKHWFEDLYVAEGRQFSSVILPENATRPAEPLDLPRGEVDLAGIPWEIARKPIVLEAGDSTRQIPIDNRFQSLHVLHAFEPGMVVDRWRGRVLTSVKRGTPRPPMVTVLEYALRYEDGTELTIPVRWGEAIEGLQRRTFGPVSMFIGDLPWASVAWTGEHDPGRDLRPVVYAFCWPNPYPEKTVESLDLRNVGERNDAGTGRIFAVCTGEGRRKGDFRYVAPDGSDGSPGTFEAPWATLHHAARNLAAGDAVFVRGGRYEIKQVLSPHSPGTPDAWTHYVGYPGETAVVHGFQVSTDSAENEITYDNGEEVTTLASRTGVVHVHDRSCLRICNLHIHDASYQGLGVSGLSHHVDLLYNHIHRTVSCGLGIWGTHEQPLRDVRIIGNKVLNAYDSELLLTSTDPGWQARSRERFRRIGKPQADENLDVGRTDGFELAYNEVSWGAKEGIDCKGSVRNGTIHHNYVHDSFVYTAFKGGKVGIYIDSWGSDQYSYDIRDNVVERCGTGVMLRNEGGSPLYDVEVHRNIIRDNYWAGILIDAIQTHQGALHDLRIVNNTLYHNGHLAGHTGPAGGIRIASSTRRLHEVTIRNNIIAESRDYPVCHTWNCDLRGADILIDYNLITPWTLGELQADPGQWVRTFGQFPVLARPNLIAPANYNFYPAADSPAVDAGHPSPCYRDPDGTRADIGAVPLTQALAVLPYRGESPCPDADPSEWDEVAPPELPGRTATARHVKLCWNQQGLYGVVHAEDGNPGNAVPPAWGRMDGVALCLQKDGRGRDQLNDESYIHWIGPNPNGEAGAAAVYRPAGKWFKWPAERMREAADPGIRAQWKPVSGGYVMEFSIPAESLAPLRLQKGTTVPLYYRLARGGDTIEEFCRPAVAGKEDNWLNPRSWSFVRLGRESR